MVSIEPVTHDSRSSALALLRAQFDEHAIALSEARLEAGVSGLLADERRGAMLLARDGAEPIGIAAFSFTWSFEHGGPIAWLDELYVVPQRRGSGIGEALLGRMIERARGAGCVAIDLEVTEDHRRAENLYRRNGFEPLARARWVKRLVPG